MKNYITVLLLVFTVIVSVGSQVVESELVNPIGKVKLDQAIPMHGTNKSDLVGSLKFSSAGLLKLPSPGSIAIPKAEKQKITFATWSSHEALNPGDDFVAVIKINLEDGWYIYGNKETTGLVTNVELLSGEFTVVDLGLSKSTEKKTSLGSKLLVSYYLKDGSYAWIRLRLREDLVLSKNTKLKLRINYQLCSDSVCLMPNRRDLVIPLEIGKRKLSQTPEQFKKAQTLFQLDKVVDKKTSSKSDFSTGQLEQLIGQNLILALFMAFLWGLLASLTPCVYPMIPITVSLFSSGVENFSKARRFISACCYVGGITLVYAILGVITSYTGRDLGSWLAEPIVVVPLSLLMILLACSMFGLFELNLFFQSSLASIFLLIK